MYKRRSIAVNQLYCKRSSPAPNRRGGVRSNLVFSKQLTAGDTIDVEFQLQNNFWTYAKWPWYGMIDI